jgi:hypothetical protein
MQLHSLWEAVAIPPGMAVPKFTTEEAPEVGVDCHQKPARTIGQGQTISQPYIVTAAPAKLPKVLLDQLKLGGQMIVPVGRWRQELVLIHHTPDGCRRERLMPVHFVPMVKQLNLGRL